MDRWRKIKDDDDKVRWYSFTFEKGLVATICVRQQGGFDVLVSDWRGKYRIDIQGKKPRKSLSNAVKTVEDIVNKLQKGVIM